MNAESAMHMIAPRVDMWSDTFPVSRAGLTRSFELVEQAVAAMGVEEAVAHRICVVVDELVANMMLHDGTLDAASMFSLSLRQAGANILVAMNDSGAPFDPLAHRQVEEPEIGGHGITLIKSLALAADYARVRDENHLNLTFSVDQT